MSRVIGVDGGSGTNTGDAGRDARVAGMDAGSGGVGQETKQTLEEKVER